MILLPVCVMYVNIHVSNIERHTKFADRCTIDEKCQPFLRSRFVSSKRPIACFQPIGISLLVSTFSKKIMVYYTHSFLPYHLQLIPYQSLV